MKDHRFVVVGLGSMGKRRIRCLKSLGVADEAIVGFDTREDRRTEAGSKYSISTSDDISKTISDFMPDCMIISVPPDIHGIYMKHAAEHNINFFVEASVVDDEFPDIVKLIESKNIVCAPSSTMYFNNAIKQLAKILKDGSLGKISNILYHSGQYLPDWHTYEKVSDFYVSNPATGGAREIVPFELSWITALLGFPERVAANVRKTIEIEGAERIDDTYNCLMDYGSFLMVLTVDVVSRYASRVLTINGDKAMLKWSWDDQKIRIYRPEQEKWEDIEYSQKASAEGYNPNIGEDMYIEEIRNFINAVDGKEDFVNSLDNDWKVLKLLYAFEQSEKTGTFIDYEG